MSKPRHRIATEAALRTGTQLVLAGNQAHYLTTVLRLREGDMLAVFSRGDGEWRARIDSIRKRDVTLVVEEQTKKPGDAVGLIVCFAPIKGGRMETIIEKATELGASILQPVLTTRTIVDKVNLDRADAIAREAAEQCERIDWPEIREPVKLLTLLGNWPENLPLIYGDESGESASINTLFSTNLNDYPRVASHGEPERSERGGAVAGASSPPVATATTKNWAILAGPEGGFTPEEFAALKRVKSARGVALGPRILRADTAIITLCALTLAAWGDWDQRPRFVS